MTDAEIKETITRWILVASEDLLDLEGLDLCELMWNEDIDQYLYQNFVAVLRTAEIDVKLEFK